MLKLELPKQNRYNLLCLGAHCDDIEIGCGGTVLALLHTLAADVHWIVLSGSQQRATEARRSGERFLVGARASEIVIRDFPDGFFPYHGAEIKEYFEGLKELDPDLIFTHSRGDLHQDHRLVCELTCNTFRNHLILEYEIPKYDGDLGSPNVFVELDEHTCQQKIELIMHGFPSQHQKQWFSEQTFFSTLTLRGVECRSTSRYAEGFYCRKAVLK